MAVKNENILPKGTVLKNAGTEYRVERFLGAGGFGITYLVSGIRKESGNTFYDLYCLKEYFLSNDCERDFSSMDVICSKPAEERIAEGKKDFIAEAKRLRDKIHHSHIVKVKDVFEANRTAYYVMEFLDGKSLRSYIRSHGACDEEETKALMLPIVKAIGYLHDRRITHLDIKPDNIMIIENEEGKLSPILIDFGLSKHYDKKGKATSSVRVMATSDGFSPVEQYQGIETFQPTADIYALTATFVYCLIGKDPKKSADIRPGEVKQLLEPLVSASTLSALLNGMRPSRYERTQYVGELMKALYPEEEVGKWEAECDNNITDPRFFRKKKTSSSFASKFKSLFSIKNKPKKINDNPVISAEINESSQQKNQSGRSRILAYQNGVLMRIEDYEWDKLTERQKSLFTPFIIDLYLQSGWISLFVEEKRVYLKKEVETALEYFRNQLNPSGLPGYEKGTCRLLTSEEMDIIARNQREVREAFNYWGLKCISFDEWIDVNGETEEYVATTGLHSNEVRPVVEYYGTIGIFNSADLEHEDDDLPSTDAISITK